MSVRKTKRRLFIAVDLSVTVVERLVRMQEVLDLDVGELDDIEVRWTEAPNIHVTLKFLGETEATLVPLIEERLERLVRPLFPFEVQCQGLGAFPDPDRARILWAGLDPKGAEVMSLLRLTIERELEELGFAPDERDYLPHVTLGRVRSRRKADLSDVVDPYAPLRFGSCYVRDLVLFESHLSQDGPRYEILNRYQLGEP